ncbi:MAG: SHOCT domain-containing protein [Planctomycetota bacterium]
MHAILANTQVVRATLLMALALAVAAFAVWLVQRLHGSAVEDTHDVLDPLSKFRELHARGGLSDEEFRTIKTKLAAKHDPELGDSGVEQ